MRRWKNYVSAMLTLSLLAGGIPQSVYAEENSVTVDAAETETPAETEVPAETETPAETEASEQPANASEVTEPVVNFRASETSETTESSEEAETMSLFYTDDSDKSTLEAVEVEDESILDAIWKENEDSEKDDTRRLPLYEEDEMVTVIVELEEAPVMDYYDISTYSADSEDVTAGEAVSDFLASDEVKDVSDEIIAGQNSVISAINKKVDALGASSTYSRKSSQAAAGNYSGKTLSEVEVVNQWTIVTNAFAVRIPYGKLDEIKELDGVKRAYVEHVYSLPEPQDTVVEEGKPTYEYSYDLVGISDVWNAGYTGKGMLVAVLDSGLDIKTDWNGKVVRTHEAFTEDSFLSKTDDGVIDWDLRYDEESMTEFWQRQIL